MRLLTCLVLTILVVPFEGLENTYDYYEDTDGPRRDNEIGEGSNLSEEISFEDNGLGGNSKTALQLYEFVSTMSNEYMRVQIALNQLVENLLSHPFNSKDAANSFSNFSDVLETALIQIELTSSRYNFKSTESLNVAAELVIAALETAKEVVDSFREMSTLEIFNSDNIEWINDCVAKFDGKSVQVDELLKVILSRTEVIASNLGQKMGAMLPQILHLTLDILTS